MGRLLDYLQLLVDEEGWKRKWERYEKERDKFWEDVRRKEGERENFDRQWELMQLEAEKKKEIVREAGNVQREVIREAGDVQKGILREEFDRDEEREDRRQWAIEERRRRGLL